MHFLIHLLLILALGWIIYDPFCAIRLNYFLRGKERHKYTPELRVNRSGPFVTVAQKVGSDQLFKQLEWNDRIEIHCIGITPAYDIEIIIDSMQLTWEIRDNNKNHAVTYDRHSIHIAHINPGDVLILHTKDPFKDEVRFESSFKIDQAIQNQFKMYVPDVLKTLPVTIRYFDNPKRRGQPLTQNEIFEDLVDKRKAPAASY